MEPEAIAAALGRFVEPKRILSDPVQTETYSYDASFATRLKRYRPDVVVRAETTEEVAAVMRWCYEHEVPVYPRGAATSQSGGAMAVRGGVSLDLSPMNRILEMAAENLQVICQPGVIHADLNKALKAHGLFFAPDPGSSSMCTIGGMIANNSSGVRAVKYGQTRHHVLGLEVVLPGGEVVTTGGVNSRALKTVSGYELTALFVGSEGTLGVVTRARLKVLPIPAKRALSLAAFDDLEAAGRAVQRVFARGILPSAIEILDRRALEAIRLFRPEVDLPVAAEVLIFEAEGDPITVAELARQIARACRGLATQVEWTDDSERAARLWDARRVVGAAVARVQKGYTRVYAGEDICVPITAIPQALRAIHDLGEKYGIYVAIYGHVGDGNVHAAPIIDMRDPEQVEKAERMVEDIHELALELKGTTTGEHGVGLVRAQYMAREHGGALDLMRLLKRSLDPKNLMNPGKMALDHPHPEPSS
ncbi:MAG: FAD-binding protein [Deinococcota bacterium]|nr:FAD-binding protein [Deinococcota bacterium]